MAAVFVASNLRLFSSSSSGDLCLSSLRPNSLPFHHHHHHHHHHSLCCTPIHGSIPPKSAILRRARVDGVEEEGGDEEEEEEEGGVEIVFEVLQGFFRKVSRRAKKAARSVLPMTIPSKLVSFAVDGAILFSLLSIVKALVEVACNLGGIVFLVILVVRIINVVALHFRSGELENMDDGYDTTYRAT